MILKYIALLIMVNVMGPDRRTANHPIKPNFIDDMIEFTINGHNILLSVTILNESLVWAARSLQYGVICTFVTTAQSGTICSNDSTAKMKRINNYNSQKETFRSSFGQHCCTGEYNAIRNRSHQNLKHLIIHTIRDTLIKKCGCAIHEIEEPSRINPNNKP